MHRMQKRLSKPMNELMKNYSKFYQVCNKEINKFVLLLTLIRLEFSKVVSSGGEGPIWSSLIISRRTYLIWT